MAYLAVLFIYVYNHYIKYNATSALGIDVLILLVFVAYPLILETMQLCKVGPINYVSDTDNWLDIIFIYGSVAMAIVHFINGP